MERLISNFKHQIFIVNGVAASGKDTFIHTVGNRVRNVHSYSFVDRVKDIAREMGWQDIKTNKTRKFLADLADLWVGYNDKIFTDICNNIETRDYQRAHIFFIVVRKPRDIEPFVKRYKKYCKTILIEREGIKVPNNSADRSVMDYKYDIILKNNGTFTQLDTEVSKFIKDNIKSKLRIR